uniref:Putative secreted protein n=1 Tax=Anopheles darlingi TaxID=43151 RepID=A0A2M4DLN4_ANODA
MTWHRSLLFYHQSYRTLLMILLLLAGCGRRTEGGRRNENQTIPTNRHPHERTPGVIAESRVFLETPGTGGVSPPSYSHHTSALLVVLGSIGGGSFMDRPTHRAPTVVR